MARGRRGPDAVPMAKYVRWAVVVLTSAVSLVLLWLASALGSCEGWKGTGSCPRVPLWEWEVFWIGFWAGLFPVAALRLGRARLLRGMFEAAASGAAVGALLVVLTGT